MKKSTWKEIGGAFKDFVILGKPQYEMNKNFYEKHTKLYITFYVVLIILIVLALIYLK